MKKKFWYDTYCIYYSAPSSFVDAWYDEEHDFYTDNHEFIGYVLGWNDEENGQSLTKWEYKRLWKDASPIRHIIGNITLTEFAENEKQRRQAEQDASPEDIKQMQKAIREAATEEIDKQIIDEILQWMSVDTDYVERRGLK